MKCVPQILAWDIKEKDASTKSINLNDNCIVTLYTCTWFAHIDTTIDICSATESGLTKDYKSRVVRVYV